MNFGLWKPDVAPAAIGRRQRGLAVAALMIGGFCAFALLELAVRVLFPDMTRDNIVLRLKNERPTWATPDGEFHHAGEGIHRLKFPDGSGAEINRIMLVGDSFVMGHGVGEEDRFGQLLQRHLGQGAMVDILGTTSYSPVIYRKVVQKALSLASYRAVAVFIDQTDPVDDLIYDEDVIEDGGPRSFDVDRMIDRQKVVDHAYDDLLSRFSGAANIRRSAAVNLLLPLALEDYVRPQDKYYRYLRLSLQRPAFIARFNADPESDESRKMLSLVTRHLDQIVAQCRERGVPLFLVANPWEFQSSRRPRITLDLPGPFPKDNRLEGILGGKYGNLTGVHVVSMTRYFREQDDPSSLFISMPGHEIHWNASGHQLVETVLRQQLMATLPDLVQR